MPLTPLAITYDRHQVEWQGEQYGVSELALPRLQWRMQLWWPSRQLAMNATLLSALTGVGLIALWLLLLYWRQRRRYYRMQLRARSELEQQVMSRTAALAATNRELEQQIQERIQAEARLRSMQHELIHSNRLAALGQMAAGVAHEVNQPLTALRNQSVNTLLLSQHGRHDELETSLQTMGRLIDRIARLTSQLKLFAATRRSTRGQTPLNEALDNILSWLAPRLAEQHIELDRPDGDDALLPMELHALEQVLANLLTNSIDALSDSTAARISIAAGPGWLQWQDNGPGIDSELIDKVTEPFSPPSAPARAWDWDCPSYETWWRPATAGWIFNTRPRAAFDFVLTGVTMTPTPIDVWLVEDDDDVRQTLLQTLQLSGIGARGFARAEQALQALPAEAPVVMLSDVRMPGMDGLALLQHLQARDAELPVVLLTGHGDIPMAVEAMRLGAQDFLKSPTSPSNCCTACAGPWRNGRWCWTTVGCGGSWPTARGRVCCWAIPRKWSCCAGR
ncbi:response regulator [Oceanimonas sp. NS1]|nr:response regulator [Oceanimonas sp. NS1]